MFVATTKQKNMKHTKEEQVKRTMNDNTFETFVQGLGVYVHLRGADRSIREKQADLIAEAFNVTNETGYTPRQLADKLAIAVEALKLSLEIIEISQKRLFDLGGFQLDKKPIKFVEQAIQNSTK